MVQRNVLEYLEKNRGTVVTGGELSRQLNVSRTAVWKAIHALQDKGHEIEVLANSGYRLTESSDGLSERGIAEFLNTRAFGRQMELHESLPSTNRRLREMDISNLPEGYAVIADGQSSGRGRSGRTFYSPAREGVYFSVLLKPDMEISDVTMITVCAAVAVCRAVDAVCGISAKIKWVNDIFNDGKKLCGILSEASVSAELRRIDSVVVGIGINTGVVDSAVKNIAGSILEATGKRGLRNRLIAETLNQLEDVYLAFSLRREKKEILAEYSERMLYIGKRIEIIEGAASSIATVLGIDDAGALLVRLPGGGRRSVISGEIKIFESEETIQ